MYLSPLIQEASVCSGEQWIMFNTVTQKLSGTQTTRDYKMFCPKITFLLPKDSEIIAEDG